MLHRPIPTLLNHCVEGVRGNVPKFGHFRHFWPIWPFLANLVQFFGQIWQTGEARFWDFPNFGQILRDFEGKFGPLAKFGFFWPFGKPFLAILVDFG